VGCRGSADTVALRGLGSGLRMDWVFLVGHEQADSDAASRASVLA
jgi:hypothetical protein